MKIRVIRVLAGFFAAGIVSYGSLAIHRANASQDRAVTQQQSAISEEARAALRRMGQSLRAPQFSFKVQTIRVYTEANGRLLHIFHTMKVIVQRPNRLLVDVTGDDGSHKLIFDSKAAVVYSDTQKKYANVSVPKGTIEAMMEEAIGRLGADFPLADLLTDAPDKAFLTDVRSGNVMNTVMVDGSPYLHLFFFQPPGIELELWLEKSDRALPRRLIVTYRDLPGQPNFIAEFSDWDFDIHPSSEDFTFHPPADAVQVQLKPVNRNVGPGRGGKP